MFYLHALKYVIYLDGVVVGLWGGRDCGDCGGGGGGGGFSIWY